MLEVMIAVAIISISIVTLMGSQSQSISMADIARFNINASLLAQKKISELELIDFAALASDQGNFDEPFVNYHFQLEVNSLAEDATGIPESDTVLKAVDLTISLDNDNNSSPYHIRSIIMNNKPGDDL